MTNKITQKKYKDIFNHLDDYIKETDYWFETNTDSIQNTVNKVRNAKRIFVTGSGSSIAGALLLANLINTHSSFAATFITTSQLVSLRSLAKTDCVILISQGYNRSDAKIITYTVQKNNAQLILFTAATILSPNFPVIQFYPKPEDEKIFSRPCGVITSYKSILNFFYTFIGETQQKLSFEKKMPEEEIYKHILAAKNVLVLSAGMGIPAATNIALALREGAGIKSYFFDIENFAHGQYAPFLIEDNPDTFFLLFSNSQDQILSKSIARISPLFEKVSAQYHIVDCQNKNMSMAGLSILYYGGYLIGKINDVTQYDMNNPKGKEENRDFHLVPESYYE